MKMYWDEVLRLAPILGLYVAFVGVIFLAHPSRERFAYLLHWIFLGVVSDLLVAAFMAIPRWFPVGDVFFERWFTAAVAAVCFVVVVFCYATEFVPGIFRNKKPR